MTHKALVQAMMVLAIVQRAAQAACPSGVPDEILCEDFNTYCLGGGYPGDPDCAAGTMSNEQLLRDVWALTSTNEDDGTSCGVPATVETNLFYLTSAPFGGKYPGAKTDILAQHAFRDWLPPHAPSLSRAIKNVFGESYDAVVGRDDKPLVLTFMLDSEAPGKIFYSNGYIELASGPPTHVNRANTDYVLSQTCATYCDPPIGQGDSCWTITYDVAERAGSWTRCLG